MNIKNIFMVCVGNMCCKQMEEFSFTRYHPNITIEFSGIFGMVCHAETRLYIQPLNLDMSSSAAKN